MNTGSIILAIIIAAGIIYSVTARKLTLPAALTGALVAYFVYTGAAFTGIAMMTIFFILGSSATSWKHSKKEIFTDPEEHKTGRTTGQVLANAGTAGLCGVLVLLYPQYNHLWVLMMAGSLASATADTLASELGTVYGKRFFNVITLKPDQRGLDGVISLEGTLFGVLGSTVIAVIYAVGFGWDLNLLWIVVAGTIGTYSDSVMGATLERKHYVSNNTVNFLNTVVAALVILIIYFI